MKRFTPILGFWGNSNSTYPVYCEYEILAENLNTAKLVGSATSGKEIEGAHEHGSGVGELENKEIRLYLQTKHAKN